MYSIRQKYTTVRKHLAELHKSGIPSEAFLCSVFMVEKIIRRVHLLLIISAGFKYDLALELCRKSQGIERIKDNWKYYDPKHRSLLEVIGNSPWSIVKKAADLRNSLAHGSGHEQEKVYKRETAKVLAALDEIKGSFETEYDFGGWKGLEQRPTSHLHTVPLVKV